MSFDKANLSEVIDLALGSQNSGVIDFNLLRSLLHIIVEKLSNISVKNVPEKSNNIDCDSINNKSIMNIYKNFKAIDDKVNRQTLLNSAHSQTSNGAFKHIESLHDSLSTIMSNKDRTIETLSKENCSLNSITNRVDDIEKSIQHLTSLSNDLTREFNKIQHNITAQSDSKEIENLKDRLDVLQNKVFSKNIDGFSVEIPTNDIENPKEHYQETFKTLQELSDASHNFAMKIPQANTEKLLSLSSKSNVSMITLPPTLNQSKSCAHMKTITTATSIRESQQLAINDIWLEIGDLKNFYIRTEVAQNFDMLTDRFNELENRLNDIDFKMVNFEIEMEFVKKNPSDYKMQSIKRHDADKSDKKLETLCNLVEKHSDNIIYLLNDREQNHKALNSVKNQMKLLKEHKVDRDDLVVILAEKADYNVVQSKVSIDQFDATKRDISQNLVEVITQITDKEIEWQKSLNKMHIMVESKLDKGEIATFKHYMKQKVNEIQDRLKTLATFKSDAEAAGTKLEIMKDLKCISCNSQAIMKIKEQFPRSQPFIPSKNVSLKNIWNSNKLPAKHSTLE
ncbi:unnamed protein product [Diamesa serratosioi]